MAFVADPHGHEVAVLDRLLSFDGMHVLDIGCGDGRTARHIARTAAGVTGVDPHEERMILARAADPEDGSCPICYLSDDVRALDLPTDSFDTVIFTRSL